MLCATNERATQFRINTNNVTFYQFDINLNRFKYVIEDTGIRVFYRRPFSTTERFVAFENIGSEIFKVRKKKLAWLTLFACFLILALIVFIERINGSNVGDNAEVVWLSGSVVCFVVYAFQRKNSLFLVKDDKVSGIEFVGTKIYERRLNQFIKELLQRRDDYLSRKYPVFDGLTLDESIICTDTGIQQEDGLLLKKLTKHPLKKLIFQIEGSDVEKPSAIYTVTTEKNARNMIDKHRERFLNKGMFIFISGFSGNTYNVGLIGTTSDAYRIMEYSETNGLNYDIETKDIIEKYRHWDKQFGIKPISMGFDFCECEIVNKDIDYKKLAAEVYEFCPDVVEQGTETVEGLEEEIKKTGRIFLWWD